jgi:fructose/tagatose bisphosphate aldolase
MPSTSSSSTQSLEILARSAVQELLDRHRRLVEVDDAGRLHLIDAEAFQTDALDSLVHSAVLATDDDVRDTARWIIGEAGQELGVVPCSIHDLYLARGRGEVSGFTVPAMNVRAAAYDSGRALFAAARELRVGAMICEIARSEIGYTDQRPAEYVAVMTAAALREGWSGPLCVQGDHFQVNAKKYAADRDGETGAVRDLIREALHAGFYNLDVDTSTLVDLERTGIDAQQEANYRLSAEMTAFIRRTEPRGVTTSVGGEIGEVGTENSTSEELRAYMAGYLGELREQAKQTGGELTGLSKISVQSGTTHGGVVLPDGSIADVSIDFETLRTLSRIAREEYGLAGAVQHGASTLPDEAFGKFPEVETAEIHLATGFQNLMFDHPRFPADLRHRMYAYCEENFGSERGGSETDEQFLYKTRKKALGVFKRELWEMPEETRGFIRADLREKFAFLFRQLRVTDTAEMAAEHATPVGVRRSGPAALRVAAAEDDWDLSD